MRGRYLAAAAVTTFGRLSSIAGRWSSPERRCFLGDQALVTSSACLQPRLDCADLTVSIQTGFMDHHVPGSGAQVVALCHRVRYQATLFHLALESWTHPMLSPEAQWQLPYQENG